MTNAEVNITETNKMTWLKELIKFPVDIIFGEINMLNLLVSILDSENL